MDKSKINILVVDDERGLCAGVQEALRREGYTVDAANDAPAALQLIGERLYHLVLTDIKMPEMSGLQLLKEARQKSYIPPLRERTEDIPSLIESFLEHFTTKHKRRHKKLSTEAMQLCHRFPWPGNVRQLRNVMERLALTCHDATIGVKDLPDFLRTHDQSATSFTVRAGILEKFSQLR